MTGWAEGLTTLHARAVQAASDAPTWEQVHEQAARRVALVLAVEVLNEARGATAEPSAGPRSIKELELDVDGGLEPGVRADVMQLELLDVGVLEPWLSYIQTVGLSRDMTVDPGVDGSPAALSESATTFRKSAEAMSGLASRPRGDVGAEEVAEGGIGVLDELFDAACDASVALAGVQLARAYLSGGELGESSTQVRQALGLHAAGRATALITGVEGVRLAAAFAATGYGLAQRQMLAAVDPSLRRAVALTVVLAALPRGDDTVSDAPLGANPG